MAGSGPWKFLSDSKPISLLTATHEKAIAYETRTTSPTKSQFYETKILPFKMSTSYLPGLIDWTKLSSLEKISEMSSIELILSVDRGLSRHRCALGRRCRGLS